MSAGPEQRPGPGPESGPAPGTEDATTDPAGSPDAPGTAAGAEGETEPSDGPGGSTNGVPVADGGDGAPGPEEVPVTDDPVDDPMMETSPLDEAATDGTAVRGDDTDGDVDDGAPSSYTEGFSVEDLVTDLERVTAERDQYLDTSRRLQAEFENYRKQVARREVETRERAAESLVSDLLPVLDACDGALATGASDVEPVRTALVDALTKKGLALIDTADEAFDPSKHDAVLHEPGESDGGPVVAEVMRAGYSWNGRVVRPAMVRVRGG